MNHLFRLDPDIQRFVTQIGKDYARYPAMETATLDEKRHIAARVRARWAAGGPAMAYTREFVVPAGAAGVPVRVHYPSICAPLPALIYAHGGGWRLFDLDTHDRVLREFAARASVAVVGVDYSRTPEARFPVALEETVAVIQWMAIHGSGIGIDATRIAVAGDSAGANLAVAASLRLRDSGMPGVIGAMVLVYGAFDNDCTTPSHQHFGSGELLLSTSEMVGFWRDYLLRPEDAKSGYACPLRARLEGLPPAHLVVAELDILHDENIAMAEKLREAEVPVSCVTYPGTVHGFIEAASIAQVTRQALEDAAQWLVRTLHGRSQLSLEGGRA